MVEYAKLTLKHTFFMKTLVAPSIPITLTSPCSYTEVNLTLEKVNLFLDSKCTCNI